MGFGLRDAAVPSSDRGAGSAAGIAQIGGERGTKTPKAHPNPDLCRGNMELEVRKTFAVGVGNQTAPHTAVICGSQWKQQE